MAEVGDVELGGVSVWCCCSVSIFEVSVHTCVCSSWPSWADEALHGGFVVRQLTFWTFVLALRFGLGGLDGLFRGEEWGDCVFLQVFLSVLEFAGAGNQCPVLIGGEVR